MKNIVLALILAFSMLSTPALAAPGAPLPFFPFGEGSTKTNAYHTPGYEGSMDETNAGGGVRVSTQDDSPNIWFIRKENEPGTISGFYDNTTIGRIGAVPVGKNGLPLMDTNYSDDEAANIAFRINIAQNGNDPSHIYSSIQFNVIDNRDTSHTPFPVLTVSGKNGGEVIFTSKSNSGQLTETVLARATN